MISELTTTTLVEWSRWQFAMTAIYHYMFVPLTLGLSFLLAIMETMWVRTGKAEWLNATKFWMKLFAINFAIGIATGLILEFQFGSNWSNYSWFVGDIFGAPLAIEGLFAFFLEATFFAVMFFGWNRVSRRFHLVSTWMVFIGSNISALWILVANAWMQNPVGMEFNPMTARNEMSDFWAVLLSPTAMSKFFHTVTSAYTLSACFVVGVSAWFILKKRHFEFARKSILLASVFGFLSIIATIFTGDTSAQDVTRTQPMKLAAMEGLNEGGKGAPFTLIGLTCTDPQLPSERMKTVKYGITIPKLLSFLGYHDFDAYVPGIQNIMDGYTSEDGKVYPSIEQRMANGCMPVDASLTTRELARMIKEAGIDFAALPDEEPDAPLGDYTGAGVIFGVTGGVTEAVIRRVLDDASPNTLQTIAECGVRGLEGIKAFTVTAGDLTIRIAVANGLANADKLIAKVESGEEQFDFIEVMACEGGCITGPSTHNLHDAGKRQFAKELAKR